MKTFNAKEALTTRNNDYAKFDCIYQIDGMSKISNFEASDHVFDNALCAYKTINTNSGPKRIMIDDIYYNKFFEPLARYFENLYHNESYHKYFLLPSYAIFKFSPFAVYSVPLPDTDYETKRLNNPDPGTIYTHNELVEAHENKAKIYGFETGILMEIMKKIQIIPFIRPVAEKVATHIVEFSKELKNQGILNAGIYVRNQFIPPMFWTSNENISKDEIMEQVDGYLNRYLFYRDFAKGKRPVSDKYSRQLTYAGYDISSCDFTNEDVLNELVSFEKNFNSEQEELNYFYKSVPLDELEKLYSYKPR